MIQKDIDELLNTLTEQEKVLIVCNYQLYDGRWDLIARDLEDRLEGRPFVLKLGERIREDIERVKKLRKIEKDYGIKLGDYVTI